LTGDQFGRAAIRFCAAQLEDHRTRAFPFAKRVFSSVGEIIRALVRLNDAIARIEYLRRWSCITRVRPL